jgi:hypothetical protein
MCSIRENMQIDFKWVFCGSSVAFENDEKYKKFLREMYESKTCSAFAGKKRKREFIKYF